MNKYVELFYNTVCQKECKVKCDGRISECIEYTAWLQNYLEKAEKILKNTENDFLTMPYIYNQIQNYFKEQK